MMDIGDATFLASDIPQFLEKYRRRGADILTELGKITPCIHAVFGTEIGREILKDDIVKLDMLFSKVFSEKATSEEMAEFRYLKGRLSVLADRLNRYLIGVNLIKQTASQSNT